MFEWFFKYSPGTYAYGEFLFAGGLGTVWWLAAVALVGLGVLFAPRLRGWSPARRIVVHGLQVASLALLLALIAQPAIEVTRLAPGANTVAVLVDTSASMGLPAAGSPAEGAADAGESRLAVAERLVDGAVRAAAGEAELALFGFDSSLRRLAPDRPPAPVGTRTRLVDALADLADFGLPANPRGAAPAQTLAAIVVLTDGAQNGGDSTDLSPLAAAGVPVHPVAIGPAAVAGDIELAEFSLPRRVSPNTEVSARLVIGRDAAGSAEAVRVRVFAGEALLATETVRLAAGRRHTVTDISIGSGPSGVREITAEVVADATDPLPQNNRRSQLLEVAAKRLRVLYLEGEPRWEFKFIRRALAEDDGIDLATWLRTTPRKTYRQGVRSAQTLADGFPDSLEALFAYHLVIIGSLPAAALEDSEHGMLEAFVAKRGGSVLALGGRNALAAGGWDVKPLAAVLPVALRRNPAAAPEYAPGEYAARPTAEGGAWPAVNLGGGRGPARLERLEQLEQWASLPKLADHHRLGAPKPAATVVLEAVGGDATLPLLVVQPYGRGQSAVLATASTWRWRMRTPPADQRHVRFWRQLARHLAASAGPRQRVRVEGDADTLDVRVALKDARFEPVSEVALRARIQAPTGETIETPLLPAGEGVFASSVAAPAAGVYRVEVATRATGEAAVDGLADLAPRLVRIADEQQEFFNAGVHAGLLNRIAAATGGALWRPAELDGLADAIALGAAGVRERRRLPLWNAPAFLLSLLLLKCVEWSLRRRWGRL